MVHFPEPNLEENINSCCHRSLWQSSGCEQSTPTILNMTDLPDHTVFKIGSRQEEDTGLSMLEDLYWKYHYEFLFLILFLVESPFFKVFFLKFQYCSDLPDPYCSLLLYLVSMVTYCVLCSCQENNLSVKTFRQTSGVQLSNKMTLKYQAV